ncbi:magnesium chelatase subunit ChlD-like protein [Paraburkholderia sp. GAS41]|uniref:vWA domain-containing protein n=1 Tax=Paraburkholderia sp. GAS41 TaxID=3035134 RepID=UPI003D2558CD
MHSGFRWRKGATGTAARGNGQGQRIVWSRTLAAKREKPLHSTHLRFMPAAPRGGVLHCFLLDCSGSMLAAQQLALAKGLLVALFDEASKTRAQAALVCFGGSGVELRFGPAVPRWWNERWLQPLGGGGGTPLAAGVRHAAQLLERAARCSPLQQRWLWVLTDGRSGEVPVRPGEVDQVVFVDFERGAIRLGRCEQLAQAWGAMYLKPEELVG